MMKLLTLGCFLLTFSLSCEAPTTLSEQEEVMSLIYYNIDGLKKAKKRIAQNDNYYTSAYEKLIQRADKALNFDPNPVTNKAKAAPSGDKHDYLSIAPYWWADSTKEDGLPWIRRDGEVNPETRGNHTDKERIAKLWKVLSQLTFAFYYSNEPKYAEKAKELLRIWFVEEATKVNPNINYGQGVPGMTEGRPFGIIEWTGIDEVVNALQILEQRGMLEEDLKTEMQLWLTTYLDWLLTSKLGQEEGARPNNHANWYDYQVLGISIYLGQIEAAKTRAEAIKIKRIATQIEPDGSQPHELARTKSLSYSSMNLKAMILNAMLAKQVGIDLLNFETADGRSLLQAATFLAPYAEKEKAWTYPQLGDWEELIDDRLLPLFSVMSSIYGEPLLEDVEAMKQSLGSMERLQYPPLLYEPQ
ncbi:MAG: alginate lyase family protein [Bacteroidota bacterium]